MIRKDRWYGSTTFSLLPDCPRPDERQSKRVLSILRVAKIISEDGEALCRIRNISAGGLMAEINSPRAVGDRVTIELGADHQVTGSVVWAREETVGVSFDEPVDIGELLNRAGSRKGLKPRAPRISTPCTARIRMGASFHVAPVENISQGGIKIEIGVNVAVGEEVTVLVDGLKLIRGVFRWGSGGHAGIAFNDPIPFDELAKWLGGRTANGKPAIAEPAKKAA